MLKSLWSCMYIVTVALHSDAEIILSHNTKYGDIPFQCLSSLDKHFQELITLFCGMYNSTTLKSYLSDYEQLIICIIMHITLRST